MECHEYLYHLLDNIYFNQPIHCLNLKIQSSSLLAAFFSPLAGAVSGYLTLGHQTTVTTIKERAQSELKHSGDQFSQLPRIVPLLAHEVPSSKKPFPKLLKPHYSGMGAKGQGKSTTH